MNQPPLVSIIIDNYNYGSFLSQAIDSALKQTYQPVEVIVVDDGSTDNSRAVISSYGHRIIPELKGNGGQASAFNAGFVRCKGEIVIFLDADDVLLPPIAARVVEEFQKDPNIAKVQYRLETIEANGARTGQFRPPLDKTMPNGDLRSQVLAFPDDITWQSTSGNAFAAWVLRKVFPIPIEPYRLCADYYLCDLPPLFGLVRSLEEVGGYYRVHRSNNHYTDAINVEQIRRIITRTCHTHVFIKAAADSLGLVGFPEEPTEVQSVSFIAHRMVSLRLDPDRHPIRKDTVLSLFARGIRASLGRFDTHFSMRILYSLWFFAVLLAPKPIVRWLALQFFYPEVRSQSYLFENLFAKVLDSLAP